MRVCENGTVVLLEAPPRLLPPARDEEDVTSKACGGVLLDIPESFPNGGGALSEGDVGRRSRWFTCLRKKLTHCQLEELMKRLLAKALECLLTPMGSPGASSRANSQPDINVNLPAAEAPRLQTITNLFAGDVSLDLAHDDDTVASAIHYAYDTICLAGEGVDILNTSQESMRLPKAKKVKEASNGEMASFKSNNVYFWCQ